MANKRLHYIDWLRVLAFLALILFHCAVPFVAQYTWEINNEQTSPWITRLVRWAHQWRLPLLFFIAGVGVRLSLKKRTVLQFVGERALRLFVPLVFAMFFVTPIQVYFEWRQKGRIAAGFLDFYPEVYTLVPYPAGALTWSHMWFVAYLFVFTILLVPVFALAKHPGFGVLGRRLQRVFHSPVAMLLPAGPFVLYYYGLYIDWPEQGSLVDDWFVFATFATFYLFGFLFGAAEAFWAACLRYRKAFLAMAASLAVVMFFVYFWDWPANKPNSQGASLYAFGLLNGLHIWAILLAAIGHAMRHLNFPSLYLSYLNTAVYPFFILHQGVIVASGYYILRLDIGIAPKLVALLVVCMVAIWAMYHFIIRKTIVTRLLFGMKWKAG